MLKITLVYPEGITGPRMMEDLKDRLNALVLISDLELHSCRFFRKEA